MRTRSVQLHEKSIVAGWRLPPWRALLAALVLPSCSTLAGWIAPSDHLWFPAHPLYVDSSGGRHYDTNKDRAVDFVVMPGEDGVLDRLLYDDNFDGRFDREARISDHDPANVPHIVVLMDSVPYRLASAQYAAGELRWFQPPVKVIAPFPSMSVVIFDDILHAPKMPAAVERYLDVEHDEVVNLFVARAFGYEHPWHKMLDWYLHDYLYVGACYLRPEVWLDHEMYETWRATRDATAPVVVTYLSASSGMGSKDGKEGLLRSMEMLEPLCMQILYERSGAVLISVLSDHGHNLTASTRFDPEAVLREHGFVPRDDHIDFDREVFVELDGLVSYFGVQTGHPVEVADVLLSCPEMEICMYRDGDAVVVRDSLGTARVERRVVGTSARFRYLPLDRDVLGYSSVVAELTNRGLADADGFVADREWLLATADHPYPDAPKRLIDAFDGEVENPCRVMCVLRDGHHAGLQWVEYLVNMASTHGGLAQNHSDAMLLTMKPGIKGPLRSREVIERIEPRYDSRTRDLETRGQH